MLETNEINFIKESNKIGGIHREPTEDEMDEFRRFLNLDEITIKDLEKFISIYAPGHRLRDKNGLDVVIGDHYAPLGSARIRTKLNEILKWIHVNGEAAYKMHIHYELLHPFTDGNGRSGRMLWAWQMNRSSSGWDRNAWLQLGFLHTYYYQSLSYAR